VTHILLVDDEVVLRTGLTFTLHQHGYRVSSASDGLEGLQLAEQQRPDVVVLDVSLPGLDGLEVCRKLRRTSNVPVIMLSARAQEADKIQGLKLGADDYVTKPFSSRELIARIEALLRRQRRFASVPEELTRTPIDTALDTGPPGANQETTITFGALRVDFGARQAQKDGELLHLSPKEFQLLWILMLHRGRALSREELIAAVWGDEFMGDPKTLDVHIRWLRTKIETDPSSPSLLTTVRRFGFRFG